MPKCRSRAGPSSNSSQSCLPWRLAASTRLPRRRRLTVAGVWSQKTIRSLAHRTSANRPAGRHHLGDESTSFDLGKFRHGSGTPSDSSVGFRCDVVHGFGRSRTRIRVGASRPLAIGRASLAGGRRSAPERRELNDPTVLAEDDLLDDWNSELPPAAPSPAGRLQAVPAAALAGQFSDGRPLGRDPLVTLIEPEVDRPPGRPSVREIGPRESSAAR